MKRQNQSKHLVWIFLEGAGKLLHNSQKIHEIISSLDFNFLELKDLVCSSPSTMMSTMSMFTGVDTVYLSKKHLPKTEFNPELIKANGYPTIPSVLNGLGYNVTGFHDLVRAPKSLPIFYDTHLGVTENMKSWDKHPEWWDGGVIYERFENVKETLRYKKNALFFHIRDLKNNFKRLPELFDHFKDLGMNNKNTVVLFVGDHGGPRDFPKFKNIFNKIVNYIDERNPDTYIKQKNCIHDMQLCEYMIKLVGYIYSPDFKVKKFNNLISALDLAPTILSLLGYNPSKLMHSCKGLDLVPFISKKSLYPKRILRVDNRFIEQKKSKVIALLNEKYRYIYRYETKYDDSPFYKLSFEEYNIKEELYDRKNDINEVSNIIFEKKYKNIIRKFRNELISTEKKLYKHHYPELSENSSIKFQNVTTSWIYGNIDIMKKCLKLIKLNPDWKKINKIAIYGGGEHTSHILNANIIPKEKFICIFDDTKKTKNLYNLNVFKTKDVKKVKFNYLLISSYFEDKLIEKARKWLPNDKKIIPLYSKYCENVLYSVQNCKTKEKIINNFYNIFNPKRVLIISNNDLKFANNTLKKFKNEYCTFITSSKKLNSKIINKNPKHYIEYNNHDFSFNQIVNIISKTNFYQKFDIVIIDIINDLYSYIMILDKIEEYLNKGGLLFINKNSNIHYKNIWKNFSINKKRNYKTLYTKNNYGIALLENKSSF